MLGPPQVLEHPCGSWLWDVPQIQTLAAQLRAVADFCIFGSPHRKRTLFWLETWTAGMRTVLLASVLGQVDVAVLQVKNMFIQQHPYHTQSFVLHVTTPAPPVCLSRLP